MATHPYAYSKKEDAYIDTNDYFYNKDKYVNDIFCPECKDISSEHLAPLHFVNGVKSSYFRSNRKEYHHIDCIHHFPNVIPDKIVKSIISEQENSYEADILVQNTIDNLRRQMNIYGNQKFTNTNTLNHSKKPQIDSQAISTKYVKNYRIRQCHINNISDKRDIFSPSVPIIAVYGKTNIKIADRVATNKEDITFNDKSISFINKNNKIAFSMYMWGSEFRKIASLFENKTDLEIAFVIVGSLIKKDKYTNMYGKLKNIWFYGMDNLDFSS